MKTGQTMTNKLGIGRAIIRLQEIKSQINELIPIYKAGMKRVWVKPIANRKGHWRHIKPGVSGDKEYKLSLIGSIRDMMKVLTDKMTSAYKRRDTAVEQWEKLTGKKYQHPIPRKTGNKKSQTIKPKNKKSETAKLDPDMSASDVISNFMANEYLKKNKIFLEAEIMKYQKVGDGYKAELKIATDNYKIEQNKGGKSDNTKESDANVRQHNIEETFERANILKEKYDKAFALVLEKENIFNKFQEDEEMYDIFDTDDDDLINNFVTLRDEMNEACLYKNEVENQLYDTIDEYTELSGEDYNYVLAQKKLDNIKVNTQKDSSKSMMVHDVDYMSTLESTGTTGGIHESTTEVANFKDGSKGVYKTTSDGSTAAEVSVYEVNKIVGWNLCPETVKRDYGSGDGSVQKWVKDGYTPYDNKIEYGEYEIEPEQVNDMSKIFVLDMILGNFDRHDKNIMISKDGSIYMIDNEGITEPDVGKTLLSDFMDFTDPEEEYEFGIDSKFFCWLLESEINYDDDMNTSFKKNSIDNMKHVIKHREDIINYYKKQPDVDFEFSGLNMDEAIELINSNFDMAEKYLKGELTYIDLTGNMGDD